MPILFFFRFRYHQDQNGMCVMSVEQPDFMMLLFPSRNTRSLGKR